MPHPRASTWPRTTPTSWSSSRRATPDGTDKTLAEGTDYTLTQEGSASAENGTVTTIAFPNVKDYAGKTIQVTYKGVVTSDAVDQVTNTATVKNNNDQTGEGTTVVKKLGKFDFTKIGVGNDATGLAGAEFKVSADGGETFIKFSQDANGVYYPDATNGNEILTSADGKGAQKTLGKVAVRGLAEGRLHRSGDQGPDRLRRELQGHLHRDHRRGRRRGHSGR